MLGLKRSTAASLQARRDRLRNEDLPAAETSCRTAKREGVPQNDFDAAYARLKEIERDIEVLERFDIPQALEREAAEAETARTAQEKADAEAERQARLTNYNGAVKLLAAWRKAMAPVSDACSTLARAMSEAEKIHGSLQLKWPDRDDLPDTPAWRSFGPAMFRSLIADELAAAGERFEVQLPGASGGTR